MADKRRCRIEGCETLHARKLFCCGEHWRKLPKHYRDAIWDAYRERGVVSVEYLQAAENAEAYLENRDGRDYSEVLS